MRITFTIQTNAAKRTEKNKKKMKKRRKKRLPRERIRNKNTIKEYYLIDNSNFIHLQM